MDLTKARILIMLFNLSTLRYEHEKSIFSNSNGEKRDDVIFNLSTLRYEH